VLIPGCVTQACIVVEHPTLVADRIVRLAAGAMAEIQEAAIFSPFRTVLRDPRQALGRGTQ
jgi:hypothetical protein